MCWHHWIVKEKAILPSMIEQCNGKLKVERMVGMDPSKKSVVVTYECTKCGTSKVVRL